MIRSILERSTRRLVFRRRLPHGGGRIWVSPSAGLRFLFTKSADLDPTLFDVANEYVSPGSVVWDVGANVGLFAFAAAHRAGPQGKVYAFEPDTWLVSLLRRSARSQPSDSAPVEVVPTAIAESIDLRRFGIAQRSRATNALMGFGTTQMGGVSETQTVLALTLDWLMEKLTPPQVLKIDVEGAEIAVLEGARRLLAESRPVVFCEVASKRSEAVTQILEACGYDIFDASVPPSQRVKLSSAPWNTLAVPR